MNKKTGAIILIVFLAFLAAIAAIFVSSKNKETESGE
jgi:uncharacterized protein YpmB